MKIAIVSLGWLGSSIYDFWETKGHQVYGTYFSKSKNKVNEGRYDFNHQKVPSEVKDADLILFNLPPSKIDSVDQYKAFLEEKGAGSIIFISSTSVYGNQTHIDEDTPAEPTSANGQLLLELEDLTLNQSEDKIAIRPAGLIGGERHPGKYLSGRTSNSHPEQRVNLIERQDLINIINQTLDDKSIRVINAVNTHHPKKREYYSQYCSKNGLPLPEFKESQQLNDKVVNTKYERFKVLSKLP